MAGSVAVGAKMPAWLGSAESTPRLLNRRQQARGGRRHWRGRTQRGHTVRHRYRARWRGWTAADKWSSPSVSVVRSGGSCVEASGLPLTEWPDHLAGVVALDPRQVRSSAALAATSPARSSPQLEIGVASWRAPSGGGSLPPNAPGNRPATAEVRASMQRPNSAPSPGQESRDPAHHGYMSP